MMIRDALIRALSRRNMRATPPSGGKDARFNRHRLLAWLCAIVSASLGVVLWALLEPSIWRALLVAFFLACPVIAIWGLFAGFRPVPFPVGDVPKTRGRTLNWLAPYYDFACRLTGLGSWFRRRIATLAQLRPGETVLDVGCGTGVTTRAAAAAVGGDGAAWGIDPAPDMIRIAMVNAAKAGSRAHFAPGVIEHLTFDSDSIDVVILSLVLHLLPADVKRKGLLEVHRVLKPGGRLLVVTWTSRHVERTLREAGFASVAQVGRWGMAPRFWLAWKPAT